MGTGAEINVGCEKPQQLNLQYSDIVPLQFNGHSLDFKQNSSNAQKTVEALFGSENDLLPNNMEVAEATKHRPSPADAVQELRQYGSAKVLSQVDAKGEMMEWKDIQAKAKNHKEDTPYVEGSQVLPGPPPYRTDAYVYYTDNYGHAICEHRHNNGGNGEPDNWVNVSATVAMSLPDGDKGNAKYHFDLNGNVIGVDLSVVRPSVPPSGYSVENVSANRVRDLMKKVDELEDSGQNKPPAKSA